MSFFLQHIQELYYYKEYSQIREELIKFEKSNRLLPKCLFKEVDYADSNTYRKIRDEDVYPVWFLWFFDMHEHVMFNIDFFGQSRYFPQWLQERWNLCCENENYREDALANGVLFDFENKAISLTAGWVFIGDSFLEDLKEIEDYYECKFPSI